MSAWSRDEVEALVVRAVEALELKLWGCRWSGDDGALSIYIDKEGGVNVEDCMHASKQIQALFHVHLPELLPFTWDVSSPGAERILLAPEHYQGLEGQHIICRIQKPGGSRRRRGELMVVNEQGITLKYPSGALGEIPWQEVVYARTTLEDSKHG